MKPGDALAAVTAAVGIKPCGGCQQPDAGARRGFSLTYARTFDAELVRRIVTTPAIYRSITDDGCPEPENYAVVSHPLIWWVLAYDRGELLGVFIFHPENSITMDVHTCLLPHALFPRGRALAAAKGCMQWIWSNTACRRIVTRVPQNNSLALRFAENVGMMVWGKNERSWLKDGKLWDQTYLGISSPEVT